MQKIQNNRPAICRIGEPYSWIPAGELQSGFVGPNGERIDFRLHGTITYINRQHRYFLVAAPVAGGRVLRECFKF